MPASTGWLHASWRITIRWSFRQLPSADNSWLNIESRISSRWYRKSRNSFARGKDRQRSSWNVISSSNEPATCRTSSWLQPVKTYFNINVEKFAALIYYNKRSQSESLKKEDKGLTTKAFDCVKEVEELLKSQPAVEKCLGQIQCPKRSTSSIVSSGWSTSRRRHAALPSKKYQQSTTSRCEGLQDEGTIWWTVPGHLSIENSFRLSNEIRLVFF